MTALLALPVVLIGFTLGPALLLPKLDRFGAGLHDALNRTTKR